MHLDVPQEISLAFDHMVLNMGFHKGNLKDMNKKDETML